MLTARQREIWLFMDQYVRHNGQAPSMDEIRIHFDLRSVASVHKHLLALEKRGAIVREPGAHRAVKLQPMSRWSSDTESFPLPIVEDFRPPYPEESPELGVLVVQDWQYSHEERHATDMFAFQNRQSSLDYCGIYAGDWLIMEAVRPDASIPTNQWLLAGVAIDDLGCIVRWIRLDRETVEIHVWKDGQGTTFKLPRSRVAVYAVAVGMVRNRITVPEELTKVQM